MSDGYDVPVCHKCGTSCDQCDCMADRLRTRIAMLEAEVAMLEADRSQHAYEVTVMEQALRRIADRDPMCLGYLCTPGRPCEFCIARAAIAGQEVGRG